MKKIVETLQQAGILCKRLTPIPPKELHSRKRLDLYLGVNTAGYYCSVIALSKKSRVVSKEATSLIELHGRLEVYADTAIPKRYIVIEAPLCSKAKALMEQAGWVFL